MSAIREQIYQDVSVLTWGNLSNHQWLDFRISLLDGVAEQQAQIVEILQGKTELIVGIDSIFHGVNIEHSPIILKSKGELSVSANISRKDYKNSMFKSLPLYYRKSEVINTLLDAISKDLKRVDFNINDVEENLFMDTVLSRLDRWERIYNIQADITKPVSYRRERIKAKQRAIGTTTKDQIVNVASSFSGGEVEVIEDNSNYQFTVKFIGTKGIPQNMDDLSAAIEDVKPAHLSYSYAYTYNNWGYVASKTWQEVGTHTWSEMQTFN